MEEKITLQMETPAAERTYILPPHPEAKTPVCEETVCPDEPVSAEKSISDLVLQAVEGLRGELMAELDTQVRRVRDDLQSELQTEILKELDSDAKIKKP